jgi:hypothetical protein
MVVKDNQKHKNAPECGTRNGTTVLMLRQIENSKALMLSNYIPAGNYII